MKSSCSFFTSLLLILLYNIQLKAQIHLNSTIDTTKITNKEAVKFYIDYMNGFGYKTFPDLKKFWSAKDCNENKIPDPIIYGAKFPLTSYFLGFSKTIYYVGSRNDGVIILKTIGGDIDSLKNFNFVYSTSHFIQKDKTNKMHFMQPIEFYKNDWQHKKVKNIDFIFPKNHAFNTQKANLLLKNVELLEKDWNLNPIHIRYFFANTRDEINRIIGFDSLVSSDGFDRPSGFADLDNNIVYCSGLGENYFHEVVHVYLNKMFAESPLVEGIACFYGGSAGKMLKWHVNSLKTFLSNHPDVNLNNYSNLHNMDGFTNPQAAIQGMLCDLTFRKDGIIGLKRLMNYKTLNDVFQVEFKLDLNNLNTELRNLINHYDQAI